MSGPHASGDRSISADTISGIASSGDHARITQHVVTDLPAPGDVAPGGPVWNVRRRASRVFVGRDQAIQDLAAVLDAGSGVVGQSVAGLGGVGKTELALHHVYRVRDQVPVVWWIAADTPTSITEGVAGLAHHLAPQTCALPTEGAEAWAMVWLQTHTGWLLVLDNVEDPDDIDPLLAVADHGRVLVTTRRDIDWDARGVTPVRLRPFSLEEGRRFLLHRTHTTGPDNEQAATRITTTLGGLPLALEQAAAYVTTTHTTLTHYADLLDAHPEQMLQPLAGDSGDLRAVSLVRAITLAALLDTDPAAVTILDTLAWLGPDEFPRHLIDTLVDGNRATADRALGLLASYSMIELTADTVSMHRLVQAVLRVQHTQPTASGLPLPAETASHLLGTALPDNPDDDTGGWPTWHILLPHVTALAYHTRATAHRSDPLAWVLNQATVFHLTQGQPAAARDLARQALLITEAAYGRDHPRVAIRLGNLACSYWDLGRPGEAVPLQQRALAITEAAYGPEHPSVAILLGNLACSYSDLGRPGEAVPLERRALAITEAAYGPEHPSVAIRLGNLACSYSDLGRPGKAVPLQQRALAITEAAYGPEHPSVAIWLGNLASSYRDLGRPGKAVPLQQRALAITEAAYSPDHPRMAIWLGNLASSYRDLGRPGKAAPLEERAAKVRRMRG